MADTSKAVQAITESRPPATDRFTYLTIVEQFLSPEILPALNEVLQDAQLTQEIGWDLVEMLIPVKGSESCLETVARLGNPREVILKILEVLESPQGARDVGHNDDDDDNDDDEAAAVESGLPDSASDAEATRRFIVLLGMLSILHKRIKTKHPSRFLATTLETVYRTYRPIQEMTASVINLVHSLSAQKRPPLPTRKSSVNVANPDQDGNASKNAPDPEADEQEDPTEKEIQQRLLLSFVTCILESFVNANELAWSQRLLEFYSPEKIVLAGSRTKTASRAFREDQELLNRDAIVGKLAALASDLELPTSSKSLVNDISKGPVHKKPLSHMEHTSSSDGISLSTGGTVSLLAYWAFASTVFEANHPTPEMHLFPEHSSLLEIYLGDDPQAQISSNPGTIDAIIVLGLWLQDTKLVSATSDTNFMSYHHQLTLCSVFHPSVQVRNAAVTLAGHVLHDDPDDEDRLKILEDLLENCIFPPLKACAIKWLQEELMAAQKDNLHNHFSGPECIELLQYSIFPNLVDLFKDVGSDEDEKDTLLEYFAQNSAFLFQAANFAYLLFASQSLKPLVPGAMAATVEQRFVEPLLSAAAKLEKEVTREQGLEHIEIQLLSLQERLKDIPLH